MPCGLVVIAKKETPEGGEYGDAESASERGASPGSDAHLLFAGRRIKTRGGLVASVFPPASRAAMLQA